MVTLNPSDTLDGLRGRKAGQRLASCIGTASDGRSADANGRDMPAGFVIENY